MFRRSQRMSLVALCAVLVSFGTEAVRGEKPGKRIPAFPGAEGFGAYAAGGRGGRIIEVTNLNAKGPGSFTHACHAKGPRIVVFRVSGVIRFGNILYIGEPFITIAGQTAPGDGICIRGGIISMCTRDVIMRYLRVRAGDDPFGPEPASRTGITVRSYVRPSGYDDLGPGSYGNVIIDHCSASWSLGRNMTTEGGPRNVTFQWCMLSESLNDSIHPKGPHGMGALLGRHGTTLTFHHCLLAHNNGRNPLISNMSAKGPKIYDIRNNVIYRRGVVHSQILGNPNVNYVGNYLMIGANDKVRRSGSYSHGISPYNPYGNKNRRPPIGFYNRRASLYNGPARLYVKDNIWPQSPKGEKDDWEILEPIVNGKRKPALGFARLGEPAEVPPVTTQTPAQAYESVLKYAGCTRPVRDVVDARIIAEVRAGTGRIIDTQEEVGGWPTYASTTPPADSDHDAMPDAWEKQFGFNPNDPADGPKDQDGDGYTNVEEFLNQTDPTKPDTGAPIPQASVKVQAGNDRIRGEAARKIGEERVARLRAGNATEESREALLKNVRENGKEVADLLGIRFVKIPPGEIVLGKVKAKIPKAFELSACEITQAQWEAVMGTRPWHGKVAAKDDPEHPATYVNYLDCQEFIRRLNACLPVRHTQTGGDRRYRLPIWTEWRYAAAGGTDSLYGFGNSKEPRKSGWYGKTSKEFHKHAWCWARVFNDEGHKVGYRVPKAAQAVGRMKPNPWGLYDMAGNVHEWCEWRAEERARLRARSRGDNYYRRCYGGNFRYRVAEIMMIICSPHRPHYRGFGVGFRLVRDLP